MEKLIRRKILIFLLVLGLLTAMLPPASAADTVDFTDVPIDEVKRRNTAYPSR